MVIHGVIFGMAPQIILTISSRILQDVASISFNKELKEMCLPIRSTENIWTRDIFANVFPSNDLNLNCPEDFINQSLYFEAKTFLHGLLVVEDKLSMAHGLETRVPSR